MGFTSVAKCCCRKAINMYIHVNSISTLALRDTYSLTFTYTHTHIYILTVVE